MKIKKKAFLFTLMSALFLMTACGKEEPVESGFLTPPPVISEQPTITPEITFQPGELKTITYYTISDTMLKEEATAVLASDTVLTPEYIVDYVADSMLDTAVVIRIDSVTVEEERIIVSFMDDSMPVCDTKEGLEGEILDAIAQSLLENLEEYSAVVFRVMGEGYTSENRSYDKNYVYLSY